MKTYQAMGSGGEDDNRHRRGLYMEREHETKKLRASELNQTLLCDLETLVFLAFSPLIHFSQ